MTLQTASYSNFFETTADGNIGASDTSITLSAAPTSDGTSAISAPFYLVIDPDSATKREVILVTASSGVTMSSVERDVEGRHATDPSHADGVTIRMAVVGEMFEDLHDRVNDIALTGDVTGTISSSTQDISTSIGTGVIVDADINGSAAIDATKIADGSVTSTEFQYLGGVTSDIQTQIDAKGDVTASSTDTFTNKTIDANGTGNSISNIEVADLAADAVVLESEGISSNDNDTTLPTSAAVKDYVDNNATSAAYSIVDTFASNADIGPSAADITNIVAEPEGIGGSSMSVSSGVFTFPETGYWLIEGFWHWTLPQNTGLDSVIKTTTNNSTYVDAAIGQFGTGSGVEGSMTVYVNYIFDVTNTSTHKVKFRSQGSFATYARNRGNGTKNETWFRFSKIADT